MKITITVPAEVEQDLKDFAFEGMAEDLAERLTAFEFSIIEKRMKEEEPLEGWTGKEINYLFGFEPETICEWLGLDYDEVMARE